MEVYIARQPIFNKQLQTVAYELLFRSSNVNRSCFTDGDKATLAVISTIALCMHIHDLTAGKKAFINFTKNLVTDELPGLFPKDALVIELLEDIVPDAAFLESCQRLKNKGYEFALDDFALANTSLELIRLADIIKVDYRASKPMERARVVREHRRPGLSFLAEKVETMEEFEEAKKLGYKYFQGFFFARPEVLQGKDIKTFKPAHYRLLAELSKEEPDFTVLTKIIESDVSMTYKLLRLINTAGFYPEARITSVGAALVRLGHWEIKKWSTLLMVQDLSADKPEALVRQSLIRAKLCEGLSDMVSLQHKRNELFLLGLFSMLDAIMNQPMSKLLEGLPIARDVADALNGVNNNIAPVLSVIVLYEVANWCELGSACEALGISGSALSDQYYKAVNWADSISQGQ